MNEQDKWEEAFERFCIMSEQSDVGEIKACKYIQSKFGREIAVKLWEKYCKEGKKN